MAKEYKVDEELENFFTHHAPTSAQIEHYKTIREEVKNLAYLLKSLCPDSDERDSAIWSLRDAVMLANASIACHSDTVDLTDPDSDILIEELKED